MSASNEWTEWHLTPRGWEKGSTKIDGCARPASKIGEIDGDDLVHDGQGSASLGPDACHQLVALLGTGFIMWGVRLGRFAVMAGEA